MVGIPRVFISYSHDSDGHRERVLALSERLRRDGIPTDLDRYVNGSPPEGWPRWMMDRLEEADFVLLVCTPTYYLRFRGHAEPGQGRGVDWEGAIVTQEIYNARSRTRRFIPVLFDPAHQPYIPEPVRGHSVYCLDAEPCYLALCDALLAQSGVEPGPVDTLLWKARPRAAPLAFPDAGPSDAAPDHEHAMDPPGALLARILDHQEQLNAVRKLFRDPACAWAIALVECCSADSPYDLADHLQWRYGPPGGPRREAVQVPLEGCGDPDAFWDRLWGQLVPESPMAPGLRVIFVPVNLKRFAGRLPGIIQAGGARLAALDAVVPGAQVLVLFAAERVGSAAPLWWRWIARPRLLRLGCCHELPALRPLEEPDVTEWHAAFPAHLRGRYDRDRLRIELRALFRDGRTQVRYDEALSRLLGRDGAPGALDRACRPLAP